jgi:hypothetical protein
MAKRSPDDGEVAIESENHKNGSFDEDPDNAEDEEEMHHHHRGSKKDKKKKKKKKVRIMHGQSDAERRVLRRRQRELHNEISFDGPAVAAASRGTNDGSSEEDEEIMEDNKTNSSSGLQTWREKNNALWDNVRFTREAVLDSDNLDLISNKAAREVEKIIQVREREMFCLCGCCFYAEVYCCDGLNISIF